MTLDFYLTKKTDTTTIFSKKLLVAESRSIEKTRRLITPKEILPINQTMATRSERTLITYSMRYRN